MQHLVRVEKLIISTISNSLGFFLFSLPNYSSDVVSLEVSLEKKG